MDSEVLVWVREQRSLLYNGYRVFPGSRKRPGRDADPSPPSSAEVQKQSRAIPLLPLGPSWPVKKMKPTYGKKES
jgi:hypothetical protein